MATIQRQVRMVFDLNKCVGCHTCSMACKTMWTDGSQRPEAGPGQQYMYWNNVETKPGRGYPQDWEGQGKKSGFSGQGCPTATEYEALVPLVQYSNINALKIDEAYGAPWEYNYGDALNHTVGGPPAGDPPPGGVPTDPAAIVAPNPAPDGIDAYASNWDEDVGRGSSPRDNFYFYLPRICNHCSKPACVAACPRQSVYKREEDGIVLVDQERCRGYRFCVQGCPYKKMFYNPATKQSEKCIFCYPRVEEGFGNFCVTQCSGRVRWVGYANTSANVNLLVDKWKVALRLHPEFGTEPNTFYIPPLSPPKIGSSGNPLRDASGNPVRRIPADYLASLFGDDCSQSMPDRVARINEVLGILEAERAKGEDSELTRILVSKSEADRVQFDMP